MKRLMLLIAVLAAWAGEAQAITVDGVREAGYGPALAIQDTPTHFGNNQSELNAAYGFIDNDGNLSLMITGNMENSSGNRLLIFVDSRSGGGVEDPVDDEPGVLGTFGGPQTDDWGTDIDGGIQASANRPGSILDPGFNPDVAIVINIFGGTYFTDVVDLTFPNHPDSDPYRSIFIGGNAAKVTAGGGPAASATHTYSRAGTVEDPGDSDPAKGHGGTIMSAFDNTNTAGIFGWNNETPPGELGAPLSATMGYEALISASFLANDNAQDIKLLAVITNGGGDFLSNQILGEGGGVHGLDNLGGPGGAGGTPLFDSTLIAGNQFFVVPVGVPVIEGLSGDYNDDDVVDAADYVVWRQAGASDTLPNDDTPGAVDETDYGVWVENFGRTPSGTGALDAGSDAVPEPASALLMLLAAAFAIGVARR
jgi:hypothetical protein